MSAPVDRICDGVRDRLNAIEGRLQAFKANIQDLSEKAESGLRHQLEEARSKLQTQKEKAEQARASLTTRAKQKIADTKEAVREWKAKRETRKLQARADRAEAYAADAIAYALATIDEAEEAVLEAVVARVDADGSR